MDHFPPAAAVAGLGQPVAPVAHGRVEFSFRLGDGAEAGCHVAADLVDGEDGRLALVQFEQGPDVRSVDLDGHGGGQGEAQRGGGEDRLAGLGVHGVGCGAVFEAGGDAGAEGECSADAHHAADEAVAGGLA